MYLCAIPDVAGAFCVLLDQGKNVGCDDAVGLAKVVVDLWWGLKSEVYTGAISSDVVTLKGQGD